MGAKLYVLPAAMKLDSISTFVALFMLGAVDAQQIPFGSSVKPFSQDFKDNFNILKYTSSFGPYSQRRGVGLSRDTPAGCKVDQVVLLSRHTERYPDKETAELMDATYRKIQKQAQDAPLNGSLAFFNTWEPFSEPSNPNVELLSFSGPYSGKLHSHKFGSELRARYDHLWDGESTVPIFAAGYQRCVDSARLFGESFFGYNYTDAAALNIIPEDESQGADSLAPSCPSKKLMGTSCPGGLKGPLLWEYPEFAAAAKRINTDNGLNITGADVIALMTTAAFELNVRGNSPWVGVFNSEEWIAFNYMLSSSFYCFYGPGANASPYLGSVLANSTRVLLNQGPEKSLPLAFAFTHDANVIPVVAALGIDVPTEYDPTSVRFNSGYDVSDIVPQGGNLILERLVCDSDAASELEAEFESAFPQSFNQTSVNATYASNYTYSWNAANLNATNGTVARNVSRRARAQAKAQAEALSLADANITTGVENIFVRAIINDAVVPLPACHDGPGKSCKLSDYNELIDANIAGYDFATGCELPKSVPQHLSFFWNYTTSNKLNYQTGRVAFQAALLDASGKPVNASASAAALSTTASQTASATASKSVKAKKAKATKKAEKHN